MRVAHSNYSQYVPFLLYPLLSICSSSSCTSPPLLLILSSSSSPPPPLLSSSSSHCLTESGRRAPPATRSPTSKTGWHLQACSVCAQNAERTARFKGEGHGYNTQQGTRPQTLGCALTDSPVGLLPWIYKKLNK
jgi:hypothetical protein